MEQAPQTKSNKLRGTYYVPKTSTQILAEIAELEAASRKQSIALRKKEENSDGKNN